MDIKKEREDFEAALISKRIFDKADIENYVVFYADQNKYQPSTTCTEDEVFATEWINVGWRMWCEAKKQATPEGFVLVPRECPDPIFADKLFDHLCKKAHGEFGDDQMIFFSDIDESAIWQLMIEAQELNRE